MSLSTDQKLDALLASFDTFKDAQLKSQQTLEEKLRKFEVDLESTKESQEEATERTLKQIKRDRPLQFQRKGHEEQYRFNADVQDHVASAGKISPTGEGETHTGESYQRAPRRCVIPSGKAETHPPCGPGGKWLGRGGRVHRIQLCG